MNEAIEYLEEVCNGDIDLFNPCQSVSNFDRVKRMASVWNLALRPFFKTGGKYWNIFFYRRQRVL